MHKTLLLPVVLLLASLSLKGSDTLQFFSEKKDPTQAKDEILAILKSPSLRDDADLYSKTGVNFVDSSKYQIAIGYLKKAIELYDSTKSHKEKAVALSYLSSSYYELGRYERSIDYLRTSHRINLQLQDTLSAAKQKVDIAYIYSNTFRSNKAIRFFLEAKDLYKQSNNTAQLAKINFYIGQEYFENNNFDSTLHYYRKSLLHDITTNDSTNIATSYNNIGVIYYKQGQLDQSKKMLDSSLHYTKESGSTATLGAYYNNSANIFFEKEQFRVADSIYHRSLSLKKAIKDTSGQAISLYNLGNSHKHQGQVDSAFSYFNRSLTLAENQSNNIFIAKNHKALSSIYEEKKEEKKAFDHYQQYVANMYSILADNDHKQLTETQAKYESTRKVASSLEREMKMQKLLADYNENIKQKEIQTAKEEEKIRKNWNYFFGIILLLIAIGVLITIIRNKEKRKANKELNLQNEKIESSNKTIQKQSDKLKESNIELEKLSIVAKKTDSAILIMDADGNFEWVNEAFTKVFGFTVDELIATVSPNIIGDNTPESIKQKVDLCRTNKETVSYDFKTKTKHGDAIWINVVLTPILNKDGEITKLVSIDSDITSIKNAEAEILQQKEEIETQRDELLDQHDYVLSQKEEIESQKNQLSQSLEKLKTAQNKLVESEKMAALGNLVAGVAHEINTPIGIGLAASTSMFNKSANLEELFSSKKMKLSDLKTYLESATQACDLLLSNLNRTAELVKSFKQVSIDNMTEQKREFVLKSYLEDIIRSLAPKIKHRPIDININCPEELKLTSYPGAFAQVFTNFIINSLLHGYEETTKGVISINVTTEENLLKMVYQDDGKGIPEKNLAKIFDPFFTTNMQEGTGLGMNITYNIVTQKLGGEIELDSIEGEGVTFTITIPEYSTK